MPRLGSKEAVAVPALTDVHTITQGGVDYSETNTQIKTLICSDTTDSTSKDTGGFILEGGLGVEKNIVNGGYLKSGLGRIPTGTYYGHRTSGEIYTLFSALIPEIGDKIIINGGCELEQLYIIVYAERTNANTISMKMIGATGITSLGHIEGSSSNNGQYAISW